MDLTAYLTNPLQIDKVCRACLIEKGDMRPLFGACLDEMFQSFTGVQVIIAIVRPLYPFVENVEFHAEDRDRSRPSRGLLD